MSAVTRVIFFVETPFSRRDYDRYGIEILQKNGFDVEVWDFIPFLYPEDIECTVSDPINFSGYRQFRSKKEALDAISKLDRSCFVVFLIACRYGSFALYRALSTVRVRYGKVVVNVLPVLKTPKSVLAQITKSSLAQLAQALFSRIPFHYMGIHPATVLLAGGEQSVRSKRFYLANRETKTIWAHTLDYDLYLNERAKSVFVDTKVGVFLDENLPFHYEYHRYGYDPPCGPDEYYQSLRRFFDCLEREYGVRIVIAAHPRSQYEKRPDYFGTLFCYIRMF